MKFNIFLITSLILISCGEQTQVKSPKNVKPPKPPKKEITSISPVDTFYALHHKQEQASISKGTVSNGSLVNGRLVPFSGKNFTYFDTLSYLSKRAFVNDKVLSAILSTYQSLEIDCPDCDFGIMECSNEHGGKINPHRTHQNGLSVDFMMPLLKNGAPNTALNNLGPEHYLMSFDANGAYEMDPSYTIDFNTMALHLLVLQEEAKKVGLRIDKVILKIELKDNLFATENGKKLKASGMYFATKLSPLINSLHDDHYHVDFKIL